MYATASVAENTPEYRISPGPLAFRSGVWKTRLRTYLRIRRTESTGEYTAAGAGTLANMYWAASGSFGQDSVEAEAGGDESNSPSRGSSSSPSSSESLFEDNSYMDPAPSVGGTSRTSSASPSVTSASSTSLVKKTARTETERRLALENDQWALRVTPHEVDCRGCRRTIKLDRRSLYYPGLWEKHRDRCEEVNKLREAERALGNLPVPSVEPIPCR
ncbi:hypothetical protein MVEN_01889900 [Mycena venus]|uniref:Uncharacterized protein n=1 Tax=Mycena venus TaxID=2733690 RepID=A0A8H6XJF1_9AGAR|nr:hypothetical protein MVEN_01889900 [Mycena venus]